MRLHIFPVVFLCSKSENLHKTRIKKILMDLFARAINHFYGFVLTQNVIETIFQA